MPNVQKTSYGHYDCGSKYFLQVIDFGNYCLILLLVEELGFRVVADGNWREEVHVQLMFIFLVVW